jgi:diadenosine tetraphosphate (Ap4A) HIT family hydrolase
MSSLHDALLREARMSSRCILCDIIAGRPWVPFRSLYSPEEAESEVLLESENFVVIADVAPIVEGHLLIIPKAHGFALSSLEPPLLEELASLQDRVVAAQARAYTRPILFEHGAGAAAGSSVACIDHAHLHVVPVQHDPSAELFRSFTFKPVAQLSDLHPAGVRSAYLYYEDRDGRKWGTEIISIPRQFFRRVLCATQDPSVPWDWRSFLLPPAISRTRELVSLGRTKLLPLLTSTE